MKSLVPILAVGTLLGTAWATDSRVEEMHGVKLISEKMDSMRTYKGQIERNFNSNIELVKNAITNFHEKCNNDHKQYREYTDKKNDCKFYNEHLVETTVHKDLKQTNLNPNEINRWVLGRRIYNRGNFEHYELIQVYKEKNENNQNTYRVVQTMLNDGEAKNYIDPKWDMDSAFKKAISTFVITEVAPNVTELNYEYFSETDHWLLNKEVSVGQVFTNMSKSINDLMKTIPETTSHAYQSVNQP